jgi:hypothetical protein
VPANSYESLSSSLIVSTFAYEICCGQVNSMRTARCMMEMVLCRLPLASLLATWCMCRRWRDLTVAPQFLRMRREKGPSCTPCSCSKSMEMPGGAPCLPRPCTHSMWLGNSGVGSGGRAQREVPVLHHHRGALKSHANAMAAGGEDLGEEGPNVGR